MSSLKTRIIIQNLTKKGFIENRAGDHIFLAYIVNKKKTAIRTKVSHSHSEIGDALIGMMAKQVKLSKADFIKFAECEISEAEYRSKVNNYI